MADPLTTSAASSSTATGNQVPAHAGAECCPKARALYQCGLGRLKLGDMRGAYQDFKEAARLEPRDFEIWLKYEETYRAVESEVEGELARFPSCPRSFTQSSSEGARPTAGRQRAPRHFSVRRPSEMKLDPEVLQAHAGEEAAVDMQARVFRPQPLVLHGTSRGSTAGTQAGEQPQQQFHGTVNSSGHSIRTTTTFEVQMVNRPNFMVVHLSWVVTCLSVLYHYRVQRNYRPRGSTVEMLVGVLFSAVATWFVWRHRKRQTSIRLSLTDSVKILSLVIIAASTMWHYFYDDGRDT